MNFELWCFTYYVPYKYFRSFLSLATRCRCHYEKRDLLELENFQLSVFSSIHKGFFFLCKTIGFVNNNISNFPFYRDFIIFGSSLNALYIGMWEHLVFSFYLLIWLELKSSAMQPCLIIHFDSTQLSLLTNLPWLRQLTNFSQLYSVNWLCLFMQCKSTSLSWPLDLDSVKTWNVHSASRCWFGLA